MTQTDMCDNARGAYQLIRLRIHEDKKKRIFFFGFRFTVAGVDAAVTRARRGAFAAGNATVASPPLRALRAALWAVLRAAVWGLRVALGHRSFNTQLPHSGARALQT